MEANVLQKSTWDKDSVDERKDANRKVLNISGFKGKTFPTRCKKMVVRDGSQGSWVPLGDLIEITLRGCLECEEIPMLEHLPNLKSLYLIDLEKVMFINSYSKI